MASQASPWWEVSHCPLTCETQTHESDTGARRVAVPVTQQSTVPMQVNGDEVSDALLPQLGLHGINVVTLNVHVVLDLLHRLRAVSVCHQHTAAGRVGGPALAAGNVPSCKATTARVKWRPQARHPTHSLTHTLTIANDKLKVVIIVNAGANVGIVPLKLLQRHLAVLLACIKRLQELLQHLPCRALHELHKGWTHPSPSLL